MDFWSGSEAQMVSFSDAGLPPSKNSDREMMFGAPTRTEKHSNQRQHEKKFFLFL